MDARLIRLALILSAFGSAGATYTTPNFVVNAPTPEFARQVGDMAEKYRDEIAIEWLGHTLPRWYKPCPIQVKVGQIGAGGATSFAFDKDQNGEMQVFGWRMNIQGCEERILDSVLPHEISHTIFACHFRRPLPRWADEGAATLVEHESERQRQVLLLGQIMKSGRRIPLRKLLAIKEYPADMQDVMTLYAEGYSLADFLVQAGGRKRYLQFLDDAHREGWDRAIARHYEVQSVDALEERWNGWVMAGSPRFNLPEGQQIAGNTRPATANPAGASRDPNVVVRGQSPEAMDPAVVASQDLNGYSARGSDLVAPEPRKATVTGLPPRDDRIAAANPAPRSAPNTTAAALDDSPFAPPADTAEPAWVAVPEDRRPRPAPLESRWTLPIETNAAHPPARTAPAASDRQTPDFIDEADAAPLVEFNPNPRRQLSGQPRTPAGQASSWSEFPATR